jgi:phage virion morphogenesis protein
VGFKGKTAQIASVHHYGGVDYVEKGGPKVKYPERPLLGISTEDLHVIRQKVIDAIVSGK